MAIAIGSAAALGCRADAVMDIESKSHDFGTVSESGGPVSYDFEFVNSGDTPLVILDAKAECGCTRPDFPKRPIEPGKKGKIKVTYIPEGRPGEFVKSVKVKTNAPKSKNVKLKISGTVVPKR